MTDRDKIRDKIAKLLGLANDEGAAPNEAETALRQAENLMRKHGIELAEVSERTGTKPIYNWAEDMVQAGWPKPIKGNPLWFNWIAAGVGKFTDTIVLIAHNVPGRGTCAKFQGDEVDLEYALWLCNHIRTQIRITANSYQAPGYTSDERWANREEFRHSMARRICARMTQLRAERMEAYRSTGTALVLVTDKIAQRDSIFGQQTYSNRNRSYIRGSHQAHMEGLRAGDQVNFARPVVRTGDAPKLK